MTFLRDSAKIMREFGVEFSPQAVLSQFAGLSAFLAFLDKGKFRARWEADYGFYRARSMMQFLLGLVVGARSMLEISHISEDPLIESYLQNPVEEAQLGRDMRSFTKEMIESLHETVISYSIFDFAQRIPQSQSLIFDIDATAVEKYGDQEGVEPGYIEEDKIERCYQYLFVRLHNRNTLLYGTIRGGAAHSQNDFCGYLQRFLPMMKARWRSKWRADSGFFNEAAFDLFTENDASFFIKAPMSAARLSLVTTSSDIHWSKEIDGVSFASRDTQTKAGSKYREVFKRTRLKPKVSSKPVHPTAEYRYDCVATNDLTIKNEKAFDFYNARANIENNIRELKHDYQLGKIITDDFDANDVITQITLLTYMLVKHFQMECVPPKMKKYQLGSLRTYIFNVPGRMLTKGRETFARIQNRFISAEYYIQILISLKALVSWVLDPPIFEEIAS